MAQYVCTFDTETKAFSVTADGASVADVEFVRFSKDHYYDHGGPTPRWGMEVGSVTKGGDGTTTIVRTSAALIDDRVDSYLRA